MNKSNLSETTVDPDPFRQFSYWYAQRTAAETVYPDSVSLATASDKGRVSVRIVLLKSYDENGFVFFTNYKSRKGIQIAANPSGAMLFYWPESSRQVRIEGLIKKIPEPESTSYFGTRPRESQIGAWASEQGAVIPGRKYLTDRFSFFELLFKGKPVEKPVFWGGYRLEPDMFEFWQEGGFRLHDRIIFSKKNNQWVISRLAP